MLTDLLPVMFPAGSVNVAIDGVSQSVGYSVQQLIANRLGALEKKKEELERQKRELEIQIQEEEEYKQKYMELLKITPLDKDLKESFEKADRIIKLGKQVNDIIKEINLLRK
jgi:hypothetical protein